MADQWDAWRDDSPHPGGVSPNDETNSILTKALTAGGLTALHAVTAPVEAAWGLGKSLTKDVSPILSGHLPDLPGTDLYNQDTKARNDADANAKLAFANGDKVKGIAHSLASYFPVLGPMAEQIASDLHKGAVEGDPEAWARGMAPIAAIHVAPETFGAVKGPASTMLHDSAVSNYEQTMQKPKTPAPANVQPLITKTAEDLVNGPRPMAASMPSLIDKMRAGERGAAAQIDPAVSFDRTGLTADVRDVIKQIDDYTNARYKAKAPDGSLRDVNKVGLQLADDLKKQLIDHTAAILQPGTPGIATAQQAAQMSNSPYGISPEISHEAINKIKSSLKNGTTDRKGQYTEVDPKSLKSMDRAHADVLTKYLYDNNPQIEGVNKLYSTFKTARSLLEDQYNRERAAKGGMPVFEQVAKRKIPAPIQNIFANIHWNTVSGSIKAKLATALANDNWPVATHLMQYAKLGVPDDQQ